MHFKADDKDAVIAWHRIAKYSPQSFGQSLQKKFSGSSTNRRMNADTLPISYSQPKANKKIAIRAILQPTVTRNSFYAHIFKRVIDVVSSSILVVVLLSWLVPLLYLLIKLSSRGPLFFVQQRMGFAGKPFNCIKFRTMHTNDLCDTTQALPDDKRITRVGRFLRASHIDELPQLINVLRGEMSLIGPRPHMMHHELLFSEMLPDYRLRRLVRPGITGLAQSSGYYGPTPDFASISCRTRLDVFYAGHVSAGLDLKIFAATLILVPAKLVKRFIPYAH